MDRGSGTLSKQMADFVIVCIIRQYTRASAKKSEKGEVTCGLSLSPPLISPPSSSVLHLLKNTSRIRVSVSLYVCLFLFTYVCRSVSLSVPRSRSVCLFLYAYVLRMSVFLYVCALRLLLVPLRLCTDEHVIVAIFRLITSS